MTRPALLALALLVLVAGNATAAGILVPRDGSPPIAVRSHRVDATVEDGLARTTLRQTFVNPHNRPLEAVYLFPLPDGASLVAVAMETGGQRYEGLLAERRRARRIYDDIVRQRKDPAIVEQIGRNTFRLSVFPVLPGKETVVELTWTERVPLVRNTFRYVYALGLGGTATATQEDLTVLVRMKSSVPFETVTSPEPDLQIVRKGPGEAVASLEWTGARLDRDIVVEGVLADDRPILAVSTVKGADGDGWFLAVVTPPSAREEQIIPRDVILVLDTSGSMRGEKLAQAKASARYLLDHLRPADRVNIVRFSSDVSSFAKAPVPATPENLAKLRDAVEKLKAGGGTNIGDGLRTALAVQAAPGRVRTVVFLTDGLPTLGEQDPRKIVEIAKAGGALGLRIFPFGVGGDVDSGLLRGIARASRGAAEVFRPGGEIEGRLTSFLSRTSSPVLADLDLEIEGVRTHDVFPRPLPDLHLGEQLAITGRYEGGGKAKVTASATIGDRRVTQAFTADFRTEPGGPTAVRDLFARQKLDYLEAAYRLRAGLPDDAYYAALSRGAYSTKDEIVEEIISVSLSHQVQSPYTAFLVLLPEDRRRLDPRNLDAVREALSRVAESQLGLAGEPAPEAGGDSAPGGVPDEVIEKPVLKDAKVSDHNETDNDMPFAESLGEKDFISDAPVDGPASNSATGIGGGAGGAFRARGGHRKLAARGGGGRKAENAVDLGLEWLKNHQDPGGFWDSDGFMRMDKLAPISDGAGDPAYDPAVTGLSLLAFLGAGETHKHGRYKRTVREGLKYLKKIQGPEGCFGPRGGPEHLYNHAIATLAMCEAYGLTLSPLWKQTAQKGIDHIRKIGDPGSSAAVWMVMALKSAKISGLRVEEADFESGWKTLKADGSHAFPPATDGALLAARILCRILTGEDPRDSEAIRAEVKRLTAEGLPDRDEGTKERIDLTAWYFGTLATFRVGGDAWLTWNAKLKDAIVLHQRKDGSRYGSFHGSWDPVGAGAGKFGRVGATALLVLCQEVYYRYSTVFGTSGK